MSRVVSTSKLASDWLHKSEQQIRSQVNKLTQLLTMTTTQKFPLQVRQAAEDIYNLMIKDGEESLRRKAEVDSEEPEGKKAKNGDDL